MESFGNTNSKELHLETEVLRMRKTGSVVLPKFDSKIVFETIISTSLVQCVIFDYKEVNCYDTCAYGNTPAMAKLAIKER